MCFYVNILIYEGIHTWMSNHKSIHYISKKDVFIFLNTCFHKHQSSTILQNQVTKPGRVKQGLLF